MAEDANAERFVERLYAHRSPEQRDKYRRYFKLGEGEYGEGDEFVGVRMGQVFALAKEFVGMPPEEIEKLLESPIHEVRAGGLSIMDKQARRKRTPESRRQELFDLYLRRTDRINNWDLVDVACPYVVGDYLSDKPRDVLYELARSENMWERRTAIVSTSLFIKQGDVDDTFRIAEVLLDDPEDLIHKAVGGWLREAGKKDRARLRSFLDEHAATMPRTMLRYAIEHLDEEERKHYLGIKKAGLAYRDGRMTVSPDPRLESAQPACRVLPEQTEGPYHRQAPPERVDITEDCEGMPLRVGLRLLDTDAVTPLRDAVVEVWQADATGRYSGFARVEPHADGTPLAAEEISDEQVAPQETFLRGSQRTDAAGTCQFLTIWPGWYSGRTIHIHVIVHLGGGRTVTTQLYFPDELNAEVLASGPYAERGPQDTTNATDTIFSGGGEDTILQLERRDAGWSGVLCLALAEGAGG